MQTSEIGRYFITGLIAISSLLIIYWGSSVVFGNRSIQVLTGVFSVVLSGLLVGLYSQQKNVLESQERIMEAEYMPILSYDNVSLHNNSIQRTFGSSSDIPYEAPKFDAYNHGKGKALNIKSNIIIDDDIPLKLDREEQRTRIRQMVQNAEIVSSVSRLDRSLKNPYNVLDSGEETTFIGRERIKYLPNNETVRRFKGSNPTEFEEGDPMSVAIVVKYNDVLGNSFTDIAYAFLSPYHPNCSLDELRTKPSKLVEYEGIEFNDRGFHDSDVSPATAKEKL